MDEKFDVLSTIREKGYESCLNNAATIFAQSSDAVFSKFGDKIKEDIINYLRSISEISSKSSFPFYTITKNVFSEIFDQEASEIIMKSIKNEMLRRIDFDTCGGIKEILEEIQRRDLVKYLNSISGHSHVLFLWSDKDFRDNIMKAFFVQPDAPQAMISSEKIKLPAVETVLYSDLFSDKETAIQEELQMIKQTHQQNQTVFATRLAGIDCTQFFKRGLSQEFLDAEKQFEIYVENENITAVCGYNISEIPDGKTLGTLLRSHDYVMLDNPHALFKRET